MCLSIPKQVVEIEHNIATVEDGGKVKLGDLKVNAGDYVMTYGDMAVEKITKQKAIIARKYLKELNYE